jgi:hypothetical protein
VTRVPGVRVACPENQLGSLSARSPGRFESDAGAAPDHDDSLSEESRSGWMGEPVATLMVRSVA